MIKQFFEKTAIPNQWKKNKSALFFVVVVCLFLVWEVFFSVSPAAVKVLDARITFKFTAFQDRDQYFASCSLENTKKARVRALVRVQLGEESLGGRVFHLSKAQTESVVLAPLETKAFVVQMDVPKNKDGNPRELAVRAKVKRVSRS